MIGELRFVDSLLNRCRLVGKTLSCQSKSQNRRFRTGVKVRFDLTLFLFHRRKTHYGIYRCAQIR